MKIPVFTLILSLCAGLATAQAEPAEPFGDDFPKLDGMSTGEWWTKGKAAPKNPNQKRPPKRIIDLDVPRDEVVAFALYTHDAGTLKLSAQLYPLKPDESREVRLELKKGDEWVEAARENIVFPGWSAHFRISDWDNTKDIPYRVRHGDEAEFSGLIRKDPIDKDVIVVGNLSCNSSRTKGPRPKIIENLKAIDPDFLFFAGDQTYHHTEHTAGWIEFGLQFREIMKDRPTVTIPDDHDVGQANLWGENGIRATTPAGPSGGYYYPIDYVNMVQRQQTWHLPDPHDATPGERGLEVYYTRLRVGGIDFAILEDRKFKSGPEGKIPKMGPRPDHINDPAYDRSAVDLPELKLLGDRQLDFLREWGQDWTGAEQKAVLSQTAFCGAVHLHGNPENRLLADLDSNAWPQTGRNKALQEIRRARATHLCGDQHLAVVVKHGIEEHGDGPFAFTSPAIINTIYGRWWHPEDEKPGPNALEESPLPWTGDFLDGLGNKIRMMAYANPEDRSDEMKRADGFGIARFDKKNGSVTFECWPRFVSVAEGDSAQFPGWPLTVSVADNDGREPVAWLPKLQLSKANAVVQVIDDASGEILYTTRVDGDQFQPAVFAKGTYSVKIGTDIPEKIALDGVEASATAEEAGEQEISF